MTRTGRGKRTSRYGFLQSIFFVMLFLTAAYVLARSSVFEVREIRVNGNVSLSRDNIVSSSGLNPGENIFKLDLKTAAGKIKIIPLVKSVEMSRRLPSAVEINVEERKPVALVPVEAGFIQVDDQGVYIQKGDIGVNQLPIVTGLKFSPPSPGGKVEAEKIDAALAVVKDFPPELTLLLSEINIEGDLAVVYTLDGIQCRLGVPLEIKQKGEVLINVLSGLREKKKKIEYIDLTYPGSPVVKYTE
ncbi:MAG: cell division protein FtsQ/DivIB [Desulfocucumaceae bacterium]